MPTVGEIIAIVAMALVVIALSMTDRDFDPDVSDDARWRELRK